jgi:hypothetical protein
LRPSALTLDSRTQSADWHSLAGWKRLALMGAMVCLPVPVFAASGLAVPLPTIVYRAAAGLAEGAQAVTVRVPGLEAVVSETTQVARRGSIRLAPEEVAAAATTPKRSSEQAPARAGPGRHRIVRRRNRDPRPKKLELQDAPRRSTAARPHRSAPLAEEHGAVSAAREDRESSQSSAPAHADPTPVHAPKRPDTPAEDSASDTPIHRPEPKVESPKLEPPKVDPPRGGGAHPPPPPPSLPPVPVSPPPVVTPPVPVPLTPKAQLEGIADDLQHLIAGSPGTRRADRVEQVVDKVESAIEELEETPPDNQGAVGDIKDATQKLDAALVEGVISLAERTLFATRLNAVSTLLKAGS